MKQTENLTRIHDAKTEAALAKTHSGQAHFAGSGPAGKTCRECMFWDFDGHYVVRSHHSGAIKPAKCKQFARLMKSSGPAVPHSAGACRFFEEFPDADKARPRRIKE